MHPAVAPCCQVKETAGILLKAVASGDHARVGAAASRAKALTGGSPQQEEQQELLAAVADHIESLLAPAGCGMTDRAEGLECDLRLLRHVAFEMN